MFFIEIKRLYWIDDSDDNSDDLCLHGDVVIDIGNEHYEESCTVSATALYLLKSLTDDHIIHETNQMLPCCGHFLIADENNTTVEISGCPNGVDWSVLHENNRIKIVTETGTNISLDMEIYKKIVFNFADKIAKYYQQCSPKDTTSLDEFSQNGYIAFWNEWNLRRSK